MLEIDFRCLRSMFLRDTVWNSRRRERDSKSSRKTASFSSLLLLFSSSSSRSPVAESRNHIAYKGFNFFCKIVKTQKFSTLRRENCSINAFVPEEHEKISLKKLCFSFADFFSPKIFPECDFAYFVDFSYGFPCKFIRKISESLKEIEHIFSGKFFDEKNSEKKQ